MDETIKGDFRRRKSPLDHTGVEYDYLLFIVFYLKFQISFRLNVERESRHALSQQFVFKTYKKLITELCDILPRVLFGRFSF